MVGTSSLEYGPGLPDLAIGIRRKHNMAVVDAIIAATALRKDVPLLTADKDFRVLDGDVNVILLEGWPKP
ncbi:MAG: PIN domain-containing protein [Flavobacteriales bacterium]|nr:PIN domain-containing protein [Flavobacteriales bacterium]